ncbi:glycosyltransferase family 2 protein [Sneathiella glossodoripedis]|uniref:glycosyltransferase family 2 protein n=1 Tax=Sneathiella glossodoripedis TaxID=418853 RepID=UPI0004701298|nr:glycosyltransferase [Sneathiella glossodoripedis]
MEDSVTIVMTIREIFSTSVKSLSSVLEHSPRDVKILFVASRFPDLTLDELKKVSENRNVEFIEIDQYLTPTQARNLALKSVTTKYVVFIDNDVIVQDGWLKNLVDCAVEEGAALVVPLIYERFPPWRYIHVAGGEGKLIETPEGQRICHQLPYYTHHDSQTNPVEFERQKTTLVEFHTVLAEVDFLKEIGGLDEQIRCMYEEWDLCIQAMRRNKKIFFEPKSKVSYLPPKNVSNDDIRYFNLRWSESWLNESVARMISKYDLTPGTGNLKAGRTFVKDHRLYKYVKTKKFLEKIFGRKIASVTMNRIVAMIDKLANKITVKKEYNRWRAYTQGEL